MNESFPRAIPWANRVVASAAASSIVAIPQARHVAYSLYNSLQDSLEGWLQDSLQDSSNTPSKTGCQTRSNTPDPTEPTVGPGNLVLLSKWVFVDLEVALYWQHFEAEQTERAEKWVETSRRRSTWSPT